MRFINQLPYWVVACGLILTVACSDERPEGKSIVLGDPDLIVTETDSTFLKNQTADIAPANQKPSQGRIQDMMREVDSAKSQKQLNTDETRIPIQGFSIRFKECEVIFNGISAHALNESQDERNAHSVSYLYDAGTLNQVHIQVQGLTDTRMEQRLFTKLQLVQQEEVITLQDLGRYISPWSGLAGKDARFAGLSDQGLPFTVLKAGSLKQALDRELRKKKKDRKVIETWMKAIAQTSNYSDPPCKVICVSMQWRISGMFEGKRVQKLIQFDIP